MVFGGVTKVPLLDAYGFVYDIGGFNHPSQPPLGKGRSIYSPPCEGGVRGGQNPPRFWSIQRMIIVFKNNY
jgi:hypothetical protein